MKLFCSGVGEAHPDFTNASRRIKLSEYEKCRESGVTDIIEIKIGYDGIVLANSNSAEQLSIERRDIFWHWLKRYRTDGSNTLIDNPYQQWNDVNPSLPAQKIEVLGPPPTSGTRDAFVELAMEGGCKTFDWINALKNRIKSATNQFATPFVKTADLSKPERTTI